MIQHFVAWIGGIILGALGVWKFVDKYGQKVKKYLDVARHALDLLDDLTDALKDHQLSPEEIAKLESDVEKLKEALK